MSSWSYCIISLPFGAGDHLFDAYVASIVKRKKSYAVVYGITAEDGSRKQKWETYHSEHEAYQRKSELEDPNTFIGERSCIRTLNDLLDEYVNIHGRLRWSMSSYSDHTALIKNYIRPYIGGTLLSNIDRRFMSRYFQKLYSTPRAVNKYKPLKGLIGPSTVEEILRLLHSVFQQSIYWGYCRENLVSHISLPTQITLPRIFLSVDQVLALLNDAIKKNDYLMSLLIQLAFVCSMRKGEILGLTWNDIHFETGSIFVNKELMRVSKESLEALTYRGVYTVFPSQIGTSKSRVVLKVPKTQSSIREVYMPQTLMDSLRIWRSEQERHKSIYGKENENHGLVLTQENGRPLSPEQVDVRFRRLLKDNNFPKVVFHSLRHSSTSYKLILSGGNIKAVQGDNGHAQPDMVLSVYAHIQDKHRIQLANQMEDEFCSRILRADIDELKSAT